MATRNSSEVERRGVPLDANRPRTRPKRSGRKAMNARPPSGVDAQAMRIGGAL
jgi:hypothetical protein